MNVAKKIGVITLAIGDKHVRLAKNLACSFLCFNRTEQIGFTILTNKPPAPDQFLARRGIEWLCSDTLAFAGEKVLLNKVVAPDLSPYEATIMIDADCMVCGSLMPVFEMLVGCDMAIVGETITSGRWHVEVERLLQSFGLPCLYKYIGSFYYFSNRAATAKITAHALSLGADYDALGIDRIHDGFLNEEVLMAVALASFAREITLSIIPESSPLKAETMIYSMRDVNLLSGRSELSMASSFLSQDVLNGKLPVTKRPLVIAFDSDSRRHLDYRLNAMQAKVFLALEPSSGASAALKCLAAVMRVCWIFMSTAVLDAFNMLKAWKLAVGRMLFLTRQKSARDSL